MDCEPLLDEEEDQICRPAMPLRDEELKQIRTMRLWTWYACTPLLDKALELAEKANELAGAKDRDILDTLSEIWFVKKDYAKAVDYSRKSLEPGLQGKGKLKSLQKQLAKCEKALAASKAEQR